MKYIKNTRHSTAGILQKQLRIRKSRRFLPKHNGAVLHRETANAVMEQEKIPFYEKS